MRDQVIGQRKQPLPAQVVKTVASLIGLMLGSFVLGFLLHVVWFVGRIGWSMFPW